MSNSVRISSTTTTNSSFGVNTGYVRTLPGMLKLAELILGAICVGITGYYVERYINLSILSAEMYFFLMTVTFLIGTFLLLLSYFVSFGTDAIISKTIYESVYHLFAFVMYLIASVVLLVKINNASVLTDVYNAYMASGTIGCIVSLLYLASGIISFKEYRI